MWLLNYCVYKTSWKLWIGAVTIEQDWQCVLWYVQSDFYANRASWREEGRPLVGWLLQEAQASKVHKIPVMSTKYMGALWSLGEFCTKVWQALQPQSASGVGVSQGYCYRPDCASGTFSRCYFLPWTSCYYFMWLGSKVTWSNLFPSMMLTEKWRNDYKFCFFLSFRTLVREEICNFMFPRSSLQRQTFSKRCQMIIVLVL